MVSATSKKAYFEIQAEGITQEQELEIFAYIYAGGPPVTRKEISKDTGIDAGSVAGRGNSLVKNGYLIECEKRTCKITGRTAGTLRSK